MAISQDRRARAAGLIVGIVVCFLLLGVSSRSIAISPVVVVAIAIAVGASTYYFGPRR
jgi:hypothetical protein